MIRYNSLPLNLRKINLPIVLLLTWLSFTAMIFIWGPYEYELLNPVLFYSYIIAINISLYLGYNRGQKSHGRASRSKVKYSVILKRLIMLSFVYISIKMALTRGGDLVRIATTFTDSSKSYLNSSIKNTGVFNYIDIIMIPIEIMAITNSIHSFSTLGIKYRLMILSVIFVFIASSIGSATRGALVQATVLIFIAFYLGVKNKKIKLKNASKLIIAIFCLIIAIFFFIYSSVLVGTRGGFTANNPLTGDPPISDYSLFKGMQPITQALISSTSFYLSHAYYRLDRALNMPLEGLGFGFSNSYFIMTNITKLTGSTYLQDISYGIRLDNETGGRYGLYWSTFYTWAASDFTFVGVIFLVFMIGYFISLSLKDSLLAENHLAISSFCILFYFVIHFIFNNPMQDGAGVFTIFGIVSAWLFYRKKSGSGIRVWQETKVNSSEVEE